MTKAIEVEVDGGSANPVRFTLDDARIRSAGHKVQIALHDDAGDPEERTRLWRGALQIARNAIEKSRDGKNEIYDGPDVWIIPEGSVRCPQGTCSLSQEPLGTRLGDIPFEKAVEGVLPVGWPSGLRDGQGSLT